MSTGSVKRKKERIISEEDLHRWLQGTNLSRLSRSLKFKQTVFSNLKSTDWNKLYEDFQRSKPINIRLPVRVIDKLKQTALQKGIGYQSPIRMWVTEKLG